MRSPRPAMRDRPGTLVSVALTAGVLFVVFRGLASSGSPLPFSERVAVEGEFRAGFEEISDDWRGWRREWRGLSHMEYRLWGMWVVALYATDEETAEMYRIRTALFREAADDPAHHAVCSEGAVNDPAVDFRWVVSNRGESSRLQGRAFARFHHGEPVWEPNIDLDTDEKAWEDFLWALELRGGERLVETLFSMAEEAPANDREVCLLLALMYEMATEEPPIPVGGVTFFEFMRAMDQAEAVEIVAELGR